MMKKTVDTIILSTLWIFSIYTLFIAGSTIGTSNYIGFGLLAGLTVLKLLKARGFTIVLAVFLLAGSFNLFQFTPATVTVAFTFSPFGNGFSTMGIQPLCSILFVLFAIANFSEIRSFLQKNAGSESKSKQKPDERLVKFYYQRITAKSDRDLTEVITHEDKYQPEYFIAAERLIAERKTAKTDLNRVAKNEAATASA